jgi:alpha-beta hydrolase superfamily lysophospholipase
LAARALEEIHHGSGRLPASPGPPLYWQAWAPAEPRAALVFVHGLAEHSGRYLNPALYFAPRGFACYAFDCRGHGRSPGRRAHVAHFDEYLEDVRAVLSLVRTRHPDLPLVPVGHSQGGLVVLRYAILQPGGLAGVVASGPSLGVDAAMRPSASLVLAARVLSRLLPTTPIPNHVEPANLCRDPAVVEDYRSDPLVSRTVSARWYTSIMAAMAETNAQAGRLTVPALLMVAGVERLVSTPAIREWVRRAPPDLVQLVVWDGFYHELFNEPGREQVFRWIEEWLEDRPRQAGG